MDALSPGHVGALRLQLAELCSRKRVEVAEVLGPEGGLERLGGAAVDADARRLVGEKLGRDVADRVASVRRADLDDVIAAARRRATRLVFPDDTSWPPLLREIHDPPFALFVRGTLPDPATPALVVVGPRRPSPYGLAVARELCKALAERGVALVSGGARGVDGCAHAAALAARAPTVAVLGCGTDVAYPSEHRPLFQRIEEAGAIVSEHPCGVQPRPFHFPVRNRLLAGWTRVVLIPEGTHQSGSLITARFALEWGREVLAVPGPITSRLSEGPNALIAAGAGLVSGVADVLDELGLTDGQQPLFPTATTPAGGVAGALAGDASDALRALLPRGCARSLDELVEASGCPIPAILSGLATLEARGLVEGLPGGLWMRIGR